MKASIFTPTHNPQFLPRLIRSLDKQTCRDFEWVVVPNNGVDLSEIQLPVYSRVVRYIEPTKSVGELKRFACDVARGDVLLELDHDDELTPDCVERVLLAFEDPSIDFVYANCASAPAGQTEKMYSKGHGWQVRPFAWNGTELGQAVSFAPSPAALAKIWYAPNHPRAWRREFYERIGGHNPDLDVLDDQDLLCRTYLEGRMHCIDDCLYVQHYHPNQAYLGETNKKIQAGTLVMHDKYIYPLAERWADLQGLRKIDLCSGPARPAGYETCDQVGAAIEADLEGSWPFEDGSVGVFRAHDALEHLADPQHTMSEIARCLAPDGWLLSRTPSTDGRGAFQDPTHRSYWNENSFWYYTRKEQTTFLRSIPQFHPARVVTYFPTDWYRTHQISYIDAHLIKPDGRTPGMPITEGQSERAPSTLQEEVARLADINQTLLQRIRDLQGET